MYWGCSGDLGHHPCKVSDPHPLSFISIVGQNYAKSAEKANFAILRCGKWALWKNWSIDIGLMYWGCSGDLRHHPCKVSDPHPLSFILIVGKNYAKSAEKANFAILRCSKWALWKNWSIDIELMYWGCSGDLGHHPCKVSDSHPLSFISIVGQNYAKSAEKAIFFHITVRQMGAVEKLVNRYWVDVLGVLRGPRASSLQSFRSSSSFLHIDSWQKLCKKCRKSKFCHITVRQMGAVEKLVHRYWVDVLGVLRGPRASSLQSFRCSSSFLHINSWQKVLKKQILPYYGAANGRCGKTGP